MASELQQYYDAVCRNPSLWSHPDPAECGCHGSGWWLSDVDTWHECPAHYTGQTHPECEDLPEEEVEGPQLPAPRLGPMDWKEDDIPF